MNPHKRRIRSLTSLTRFRDHAVEQARIVHANAKQEFELSQEVQRELEARISGFESDLRRGLGGGSILSIEVLARGRVFLDVLHLKLHERKQHTQTLEKRFTETEDLLGVAFRERETVKTLRKRTIANADIEETRRNHREVDELWLVGGGRA